MRAKRVWKKKQQILIFKNINFDNAKEALFWNKELIPESIESKIEEFEHKVFALQSKLENKIEQTSSIIDDMCNSNLSIQDLQTSKDIKEIWEKIKGKIFKDWVKLGKGMDQDFREAAKQLGASDETVHSGRRHYRKGQINYLVGFDTLFWLILEAVV